MNAKRRERKPIQCVCTILKMASRLVGRTYDNALAAAGINVVQYSILINVSRYEPIAHMELASHLEMDRTTLYCAVAVLEKHGLLTTRPTGEGAAEALSLTAEGRKVTAPARSRSGAASTTGSSSASAPSASPRSTRCSPRCAPTAVHCRPATAPPRRCAYRRRGSASRRVVVARIVRASPLGPGRGP